MTVQSTPPAQSSSMLLFRLMMGGVGLVVLLCLLFIIVGPVLLSERNGNFDYIPPTRNRTLLAQLTSTVATPSVITTKTLIPLTVTPILTETAEIITPVPSVVESSDPTASFTYLPPTRVSPTATVTAVNSPTLEATDTPSATATFTASFEPSHTPSPTKTPRPSATSSPTRTSTATASPSRTSTATQTASVTSSPSPSLTPTTTIQRSPTVFYSEGRPLKLLYNASSFYVANPNNTAIEIGSLSFETLDGTGQKFSGNLWAEIYGTVEPSGCVAIEIFGAHTALEPSVCSFYNATINPPDTSATIFWTMPARQFVVFWNDAEIARCKVADGECLIFVP